MAQTLVAPSAPEKERPPKPHLAHAYVGANTYVWRIYALPSWSILEDFPDNAKPVAQKRYAELHDKWSKFVVEK